jgi:hypothetical protein
VGLAANRFLAKIASDLDKPRGFAVIGQHEATAFLANRPVSILPGVGPVFARTLSSDGYRTVGRPGRRRGSYPWPPATANTACACTPWPTPATIAPSIPTASARP